MKTLTERLSSVEERLKNMQRNHKTRPHNITLGFYKVNYKLYAGIEHSGFYVLWAGAGGTMGHTRSFNTLKEAFKALKKCVL